MTPRKLYILALAAASLLFLSACDERERLPLNSIRFEAPQPAGGASLKAIPRQWHGTYKAKRDSLMRDPLFPHYELRDSFWIEISAKEIVRRTYKRDKSNKFEIDSMMRDTLKRLPKNDDERLHFARHTYWKTYGIAAARFHELKIIRDTLYYAATLTDTVRPGGRTPLRALGNALLLNYTTDAGRWRFLHLTQNPAGEILVSAITDSLWLARAPGLQLALTPIACDPKGTIPADTARDAAHCYALRPTPTQLQQLVQGGLQPLARYARVKK
jgi:hypothetical protein